MDTAVENVWVPYKLTVFTPTYNRDSLLPRLYGSLLNQTDARFIWLVVDDGSTDGTKKLIEGWKHSGLISIGYHWQENGGKHVAHNTGVALCNTPYFVCVDSDDWLPEGAVEKMHSLCAFLDTELSLAGAMGAKIRVGFPIGGDDIFCRIRTSSISSLYENYGFTGETVLLFKTSIIKEYPFPMFEKEKFVTEGVVYDKLSRDYEMLLTSDCLTYAEYQPNGYSANIRHVHKRSPRGYLYYLNQKLVLAETFGERYRACIRYLAGCASIGRWGCLLKIRYPLIAFLSAPKAAILYFKIMLKPFFLKKGWLKRK